MVDCVPSHRSIGMFSFIEPGCRSGAMRPHCTIITRIVALSAGNNKVVPARIKTQWPATDQDSIEEVRVLTLGVKMLECTISYPNIPKT